MLAVSELATTATPVTSAVPTINAAAVIAVRRGLRAELCRPSLPGIDHASTAPSIDTAGRAITGVNIAIPTNPSSTPPSRAHRLPSSATPMPAAVSTAPATVSLVSGLSGVAASRIAAIGGIRDARTAGRSAATTVTTTPTAYAAITAETG